MRINRYIDYAILKPFSDEEVIKQCKIVVKNKYYSVCTTPSQINVVYNALRKSKTASPKVSCVLNFPLGINSGNALQEDDLLAGKYVDEYDIVLPLWLIANHDWSVLELWCRNIRGMFPQPLKGIIEIGYWNETEIKAVTGILISTGWDFVKTCTGFGPRGVTVEDIKLLKEHAEDLIKIKASAGIKTLEQAKLLIEAGADRLGTSSVL